MSATLRESIRRNRERGRQCEVSGCFKPVQQIGRLCHFHDETERRTGHPLGHTVRVGELKPYLKRTSRYIKEHKHHPAIAECVRRIAVMIHGERRRNVTLRPNATAHERLAEWFDRIERSAIEPDELLSIVAAMFLLREAEPHAFRSDRHFSHQLSLRFLRKAPAPVSPQWRGGAGSRRYDRITVKTRELLAKQLGAAIGLLSLRMARTLNATANPYSPEQEAAIRAPLPSTQHKEKNNE